MKRTISMLAIVLFLVGIFSPSVYALDSYADAKIDANLTEALSGSTNEKVTAFVTMNAIDDDEFIALFHQLYPDEYAVYMYAKYDDASFLSNPLDVTDDMIQDAIECKRALYKRLCSQINSETITRYYESDDIQFISGYAPVAIVETDTTSLTAISRNSAVLSIEYCESETSYNSTTNAVEPYTLDYEKIMEGIDLANSISRADVVRDSKNLTGDGIKIGVVEVDGVPDITNPYLSSASITIRPGDTAISHHATAVTSVLVATEADGTAHGIVPDADVYCSMIGPNGSFFEAVEWLIDNGVNIINASLGDYGKLGSYDDTSAWVDHIAIQHDVHFVVAAGNYRNDEEVRNIYYITAPGMAYNAITVGNFHAHGSDDITGFSVLNAGSCYIEYSASTYGARAEKPNLVANGCFSNAKINPNGTRSDYIGTSFATPQVTGVIAQLCDHTSGLKTKQTQMGAILAASSAEKVEADGTGEKGDVFLTSKRVEGNTQISNREGAGILDARWAWGIVANHNHWSANLYNEDFPYTHTVTIDTSKNTLTRVAIFWLKRNNVSPHVADVIEITSYPLPNLNLYVYAPDGTLLAYSTLTYANFEIVQFVPPETGEYRIVITGSTTHRTNVGISVW